MRSLGLLSVLALTSCAEVLGADFDEVRDDTCSTPEALRCGAGRAVNVCTGGHWTPLYDCYIGSHCVDAPTPACVPDTVQCKYAKGRSICVRNALITCDAAGKATSVEDCKGACSKDACIPLTQTALGSGHTCGLFADGSVRCMGGNFTGVLGISEGLNETRAFGAQVVELPQPAVEIVSGESFVCARTESGSVICWGTLIEDADHPPSSELRVMPGLQNIVALYAGGSSACALDDQHRVFCWGANESGQLCWDVSETLTEPRYVSVLDGTEALAMGPGDTCALFQNGTVGCCGRNDFAAFDPTPPAFNSALGIVTQVGKARAFAVSEKDACVVEETGSVRCWGQNPFGSLCAGDFEPHWTPTLALIEDPQQLLMSHGTLSLDHSGHLECCGNACQSPLTPSETATPLMLLYRVDSVNSSSGHSCAKVAGQLVCWGFNGYGAVSLPETPVGIARPVVAAW